MSTYVDVDQIWLSLGQWGSYQRRQLIVLLLAIWSCGFHVLSIVFLGYRPQYECKEIHVGNSTTSSDMFNQTVSRQYEKCTIKTVLNDTGAITVSETGCTNGWKYHDYGPFSTDRSVVSEWDLVCERKELAEVSQTLVMLGQGIGAFIFTSLSDRYGRKVVHITCHVTLFGIALATAFVPNFSSFAVMRVLTGAFQQGTGLTIAILNLELLPKGIRGYVEVFGLLFWTTGIAIITPVSYIFRNMSWRYLQICLACLSSWALIEWWLIDESLRWLIANGRIKEAKAIIQKACKRNNKDYDEIVSASGFRAYEMQSGIVLEVRKEDVTPETESGLLTRAENGTVNTTNQKDASTKAYTAIDLIKSKRLFLTSIIMWFAWITNSSTYYGIMLISSSLAGDRFLNFFLGSIVEYPAAFMEWSMINRYGRKPTAIAFHSICGVALITATVLTTTANGNSAMILGSTVFTLIGKFAITGSFSTIFLYTPELYPTNMRNVGIGMSSAAARIGGMLAPFSRNLAETALWAPGLVFGIMCAIVSVSMFWVPETNQYELPQTLEECERWYKDNRFKIPCVSRRETERTESDQQIS
ncbi:organic cation transporter protein-like isoform X1 [Mercenaria mercenaria]|uniref:organic cation transporter protein-like isoform X1 n=2 Tax=Mercenaria mercenaria TaxID=6596 RepID=UPI00234F7565|nr:organic cation transporter protein-like isoform X1 [Mercenaria mercenaria]